MIQKLKLSSRRVRQIASGLVAVLMIGSVSYLGVKLYNSSRAATPGTVFVAPASGTYAPGSTISITVREESGSTPINSVQFFLNYNASQLQYLSKVETGEFNFEGPTSTSDPGIIRVQRGMQGSTLTGEHAVVTLNFKVLASSGSTSVTIDGNPSNTQLVSNGQNILQGVAGGTYNISSGTTPPPGVTKDAVLSMTPASGNFTNGSTVSVAIRLNSPSQNVYSAQTIVVYPANQLQYLNTTNSGVFPSAVRTTNTSGQLDLIRGTAPGGSGFKGDDVVATVNFKVIGTSGSIPLSYRTGTGVFNGSGQDILGSSSGRTYTVASTGTPGTPPPATAPPATSPPATSPPGGTAPPPTKAPVLYKPSVTYAPQSGGSASISGDNTQIQGDVQLAPVVDPEILAENPGDSIVKVEYLIGKKLVATKTAVPFTFNLNTKDYKNGVYVMTIKTHYKSGTVDTSTDRISVKNPVTLGYITKHYMGAIIGTILALILAAFLIWKFVWPRFFGGGGTGDYDSGYNGYDGYVDPGALGPMNTTGADGTPVAGNDPNTYSSMALPETPEPAVISPTNGSTVQPQTYIAPEQAAAAASTPSMPVNGAQSYEQPTASTPAVIPDAQPAQTGVTTFHPEDFNASDAPTAPTVIQPTVSDPGQAVPPSPTPNAPAADTAPTVIAPERRQF